MKKLKCFNMSLMACLLLLVLSCICISQNAQAMPSAERLKFFAQNDIIFYDPNDSCVSSGSAGGIYKGTAYALTEEELHGITRMANNENGNSVATIKTEASQMANLYEVKYGETDKSFVEYISTTGWYSSGSTKAYGNSSLDANIPDEYFEAVRDVIINGNRTLPQEVFEHATFGARYIKATNDGVEVTEKKDFICGKTVITEIYASDRDPWIFWDWADAGTMAGDPFGYYESNPPEATTTTNVSGLKCSTSNVIADKAIELAWPQSENTNAKNAPTDALEAARKQNPSILVAKDCGSFVGATILASGVDPDFPSSSTAAILDYLKRSELWSEITPATVDDLLPGDVFVYRADGKGHTLIYLGNNQYAEAALGEFYGAVRTFSESDGLPYARNPFNQYIDGKKPYHIFRLASTANSYSVDSSGSAGCSCNNGATIESGGYTSVEEAEAAIIDAYNAADLSSYNFLLPNTGDFHDNCVAFSNWFIINYTNITTTKISGDGRDIASNLVDYAATQGITLTISSTPSVYSVASWTEPSVISNDGNHTGIIVGIDAANDIILVAQASWNVPNSAEVKQYSLSQLTGSASFQYVNINNNLTKGMVK